MTYEQECGERIGSWETKLKELAKGGNGTALQTLKTAIDAQLALADLRIRVRQADHAKLITWLEIGLPTVGAILGSLIGGWLAHRP